MLTPWVAGRSRAPYTSGALADTATHCSPARLNGTTTEASHRVTSSGALGAHPPRGYSAEMASSSTTAVQQFDLTP